MSAELKAFYIALQQWIDSGCFGSQPFVAIDSICPNCYAFCKDKPHASARVAELRVEIIRQFIQAKLDSMYPFNSGEDQHQRRWQHQNESLNGTVWTNEARLAWVKKHATEAGYINLKSTP